MKIENKEVSIRNNYLYKVTYVPPHAKGDSGHKDCEQGVIISMNDEFIRVLYNKDRTVQSTRPEDLVWG